MSSTTQAPVARSRSRNVAAGILVVIALLSGSIAVSVYFPVDDDPFEDAAKVLIATFGAGMALLAALIALVPFRRGERWAWAVLWVWPLFFVAHVIGLGTVIPDGIFALVTAAALLMSRP
jgi:hypothetical protein